jgi:Cu-Zn family superoxide dismutase
MNMSKHVGIVFAGLVSMAACQASSITTMLYATDGSNKSLGQVEFRDTPLGLLITPDLTAAPIGLHGFHLHQKADCSDKGMAAGGHFDPKNTETHQGPYGNGHLGDLPVLYVDMNGEAHTPTLAPRLKTEELKGLSVMVHSGGDNYTDTPPLGGGGARWACGAIK